MIEGSLVFAAIVIFLLWRWPIVVFIGLLLFSLKWFPAGPVAATVLGAGFSLWRWPFTRHAACNGTGRNHGSTRLQYGRCRGCSGGEVPAPGARLVGRLTRSKQRGL